MREVPTIAISESIVRPCTLARRAQARGYNIVSLSRPSRYERVWLARLAHDTGACVAAEQAEQERVDRSTLNQRAGSMLHSGRATPPMTGTQPSCRAISTHFHEFLRPTINCIALH